MGLTMTVASTTLHDFPVAPDGSAIGGRDLKASESLEERTK